MGRPVEGGQALRGCRRHCGGQEYPCLFFFFITSVLNSLHFLTDRGILDALA